MEFYNDKIQLDKEVIIDVFKNIKTDTKMLVFGLGYDSKMWFNSTSSNTFFIENKEEYIQLNKNDIPDTHIIKYDYPTRCSTSHQLSDDKIKNFFIPEKILELAPFDIIIIDGPEGFNSRAPGRLLPCYWSTLLSKENSLIYIDDSSRFLEDFCIKKYFSNKDHQIFPNRKKCTKIIM